MRTYACLRRRSSRALSEVKASPREGSPPKWILLVAVILLKGLEARSAHGAENERPAKEQTGSGALLPQGESVDSHEVAPRGAGNARTRGLGDARLCPLGKVAPRYPPRLLAPVSCSRGSASGTRSLDSAMRVAH